MAYYNNNINCNNNYIVHVQCDVGLSPSLSAKKGAIDLLTGM